MKRKRFTRYLGLLLLVVMISVLSGCKKGEDTEGAPEQYLLGEETVPALTQDEEVSVEGSVEETEAVYTYSGLADTQTACAEYLATLTGDDGFQYVDDTFTTVETPELTETEGTVTLARDAAADGSVCVMQLEWTEDACTVTLTLEEGSVQAPTEKLNLTTAVEYLESLEPSALGLEGATMDDYQIYAPDGVVFVNGNPCLHLQVYRADNPEQTNELSGDFLVTGDKRHLYSLDAVNGKVTELL